MKRTNFLRLFSASAVAAATGSLNRISTFVRGNRNLIIFQPWQSLKSFAIDKSTTSPEFNVLDEVRWKTEHEATDIENLARMIVDPAGEGIGQTSGWVERLRTLRPGKP